MSNTNLCQIILNIINLRNNKGHSHFTTMTYLPPAPEGWGKVMFSYVSVCMSVHTGGTPHLAVGGYPFPGPGGGIPHPRVTSPQISRMGYPLSGPGMGVPPPPHLDLGRGYPHLDLGRGTPPPGPGKGVPSTWTWEGSTPWPDLERGTHPPPTPGKGVSPRRGQVQGWGGGGCTPTRTASCVLAKRWAVCLLRSCRRTFLFNPYFCCQE